MFFHCGRILVPADSGRIQQRHPLECVEEIDD